MRSFVVGVLAWALMAWAGCSSSGSSTACEQRGVGECLAASACAVVLASERPADYSCVDAGRCGEDFDQVDGTVDSCEARDGCSYVPGECFCAPGLTCICGGGPPPRCVETGLVDAEVP